MKNESKIRVRRGPDKRGPRLAKAHALPSGDYFVVQTERDTTEDGPLTFVSLRDAKTGERVTVATPEWDRLNLAVMSLRGGRTGDFDTPEEILIPGNLQFGKEKRA